MTFLYSDRQLDQANDETNEIDEELVLISLTIGEDIQVRSTTTFNTEAKFPVKRRALNGGQSYVILMPDSGLGELYNRNDMEVSHKPEDIARALLSDNYLPPEVFGPKSRTTLRRRVLEYFDIDDMGVDANEYYRERLEDIAGIENTINDDDASEPKLDKMMDEHSYGELKSLASDMGIENPHQDKETLAEYVLENKEE